MSSLIQPDRLALVYCPDHSGGEFLIINKGDEVLKYHVVRMLWRLQGVIYTYLQPPVVFVLAALEEHQASHPEGSLGLAPDKCAACRGFDNPGFNRLRKRRKK
jgi:hypothetical protein